MPTVLVLVAAMSVIAISLIENAQTDSRVAAAYENELRMRRAADGGIELAIFAIKTGGTIGASATYETYIGSARVKVTVEHESGKIDLNVGAASLIEGLLRHSDLDPMIAAEIVEQLQRDRLATPPRVFHAVDELLRIPGMNLSILRRVEPALTVFGGSPGINTSFAPRAVLLAVPGMTEELVDELIAKREAGLPLSSDVRHLLDRYDARARTVVRIVSTARAGDDLGFSREAIVELPVDRPPIVLSWKQRPI